VHQAQLKDSEFTQFQKWLHQSTGIHLSSAKKALVAGRLSKRLKHLEIKSYGDYFQYIKGSSATCELQMAIDLLTTNETYFFREPKHFDFLRTEVLPAHSSGKVFRVWSAASSSGEEAYTIAMTLADTFSSSTAWEILGSDISTQVLAIAQSGHYPLSRAQTIPPAMLSKYCLKGTGRQEGTFLVEKNLRSRVNFCQLNLNENLPDVGHFDVIFLRNVMIYFDLETKRKVVERIIPRLKSGGYFIVSHSESLNGITDELKLVVPSIYRKP
jgi:chemotaxis protein methyltransferase CheR